MVAVLAEHGNVLRDPPAALDCPCGCHPRLDLGAHGGAGQAGCSCQQSPEERQAAVQRLFASLAEVRPHLEELWAQRRQLEDGRAGLTGRPNAAIVRSSSPRRSGDRAYQSDDGLDSSTAGRDQGRGRIGGGGGRRRGDRLGVVALPVAVATHPVVVLGRGILRRGVEDGGQESAEGVVLAGAVLGAVAVRREQGLADVMRGVIGEVVLVLRVRDVRQVAQRRLGLPQERRAALLVDWDRSSRLAATSASTAPCCAVVRGVTATGDLR
jgi:hypothetical protein